ncbi:MAG TPA: TetR/AcrR family transcriptional regulator [Thermomicrobiales bacterium]|jgi:AcrR family transcriptional regulator|nr:TetR/AcrR family transcriptional regulator [Thermomicrobiales bacterium]
MPRPPGARDAAYEERRTELLRRLRERLDQRAAGHASLRDLATAAGVSVSTLGHYFGRRDDVIRAVLDDDHRSGEWYLGWMMRAEGPFEASVTAAVVALTAGLAHGELSQRFATGLTESLRHPTLGPVFLDRWLEPMVKAVEARLGAHVAQGEMRAAGPDDVRVAALALVSPLLLAAMHQRALGGDGTRPLDLDAFATAHAAAFIRAWSTRPAG